MAQLTDLPEDVLEIIFDYLVRTGVALLLGAASPREVSASVATVLRLVCRKWADWLYVHHLYRSLTFDSSSQALEFINQFTCRPQSRPRPRCQHLAVWDLWSKPPPAPSQAHAKCNMMSSCDVLDGLLGLFSDTIVELELEFVQPPWLPIKTVNLIGELENLRTLRLIAKDEQLSSHPIGLVGQHMSDDQSYDSLRALILGARGLKSLDLTDLPLDCIPTGFESCCLKTSQMPMITELDITSIDGQSLDGLVSLTRAFQSSLKVLSIQGVRCDAHRLLPVFENVRERLEGLFISHEAILAPILDFRFPKLRVFRINYWNDSIADFLSFDLFSHAPIEVLGLYSHTIYRRKRSFPRDPFANLPKLRRLVFLFARLGDQPPRIYLDACKAHHVQPVYLSRGSTSQMMNL